ncbi:histamine N-methyltransferase-like [Ptychodera flava]|uniref:histamine N-methyltransferase-like n=1 Tax=Ptychodera flava TaxID=63121 RepID=UPI00396A8F3B
MTQVVKTLHLYPKEYFTRFLTLKKYGYNHSDKGRQTSIEEIFGNFEFCNVKDSSSALHVLAIGTSNGVSDIPIIDALSRRFERIEYTVVEPAEDEIRCFKELVASRHGRGNWNSTHFKFHPITIEKYLKELEAQKFTDDFKFDIIHTLHCAYHFQDPDAIFQNLYGLLNKGGILFNIMSSGAWIKITAKIHQIYGQSEMKTYNSALALREVMQRQLPKPKIQIILKGRNVKVNECFKEDSKDGNEMLDFIVQILDFKKTAAREIVEEITAMLKESCLSDGSDMIFPAYEEVTVFKKE